MTRRGRRRRSGSPQDWLIHATSDVRLARLARGKDGILSEQVCFHAQQACEKALKAVLLFKGLEVPFVHDLEALLEIGKRGGLRMPHDVREAGLLSPYAVEARYPGYEEEIRSADVDQAVRVAECVVAWASVMLGARGHSK